MSFVKCIKIGVKTRSLSDLKTLLLFIYLHLYAFQSLNNSVISVTLQEQHELFSIIDLSSMSIPNL